jgi:glycosyltransferase involved in cell wall biosynthesis
MNQIRVCMVSQDFLPNIGGIATHILKVAEALVRAGHPTCVLKSDFDAGSLEIETINGVEVHRLKMDKAVSGRVGLMRNVVATRRYLIDLLDRKDIDIVHWHQLRVGSWQTRFIGRQRPRVFTNHTSHYLEFVKRPWSRLYLRFILSHADQVIAPSRELAEASLLFAPAECIHYIPNGVDMADFEQPVDASAVRKRFDIPTGRQIIICPRRLAPKNGIEYLIRALPTIVANVPQAHLLIVGGGFPRERERLLDIVYADHMKDHVLFTGNVPYQAMSGLYSLARVAVFPSLVEATSLACLEAQASRVAVVATNVGGLPEIITDGHTGLLVNPRDPEALAQAVCRVLLDTDLQARLAQAAHDEVEARFTWDVTAQQVLKVYRLALASHHQGVS